MIGLWLEAPPRGVSEGISGSPSRRLSVSGAFMARAGGLAVDRRSLDDARHARDGGAVLRRHAVEIEGVVDDGRDAFAEAQHEAAADAVGDEQVIGVHAGVDHFLAAVWRDLEDRRGWACCSES
jgi:hypothetical protein